MDSYNLKPSARTRLDLLNSVFPVSLSLLDDAKLSPCLMLVAKSPFGNRRVLSLRCVVSLGADSLRRERCDFESPFSKWPHTGLDGNCQEKCERPYLETACKCQTVTGKRVCVGFTNVLVRSLARSASAGSLALFFLTFWSRWDPRMWAFMLLQVFRLQHVVRPVWLRLVRSQHMEEPHGQVESKKLLVFLVFAFIHDRTAILGPRDRCILHQSTFAKRIFQRVRLVCRVN